MEWKLSGEIKPESDDEAFFEERVNHSCFKLKRYPSCFFIFGGVSSYSKKYNDIVKFSQMNPTTNDYEWTYSIVSKGNSYEAKKSSMFGMFGFGGSTINKSTTSTGPQYPTAREGHTSIVWETEMLKYNPTTKTEEYVMEEQVILFGGYDGSAYLNDVWVLDTSQWKWTKCDIDSKQSRPCGRKMHTALLYNDCMWVFGGDSGSDPLNDFWCLDLETKTWTQVAFDKTKAPEPRYGHSGVVIDMSPIYETQAKQLYNEMLKNKNIDKSEIKMPTIEKNQYHMIIMFGFSNIHAMYIGKITEKLNTKQLGGTCYNDVWSFNFNTSKWHCLTDPSKSAQDDKDKGFITKMVDVTKGVTNATFSQIKGLGKQLEISGKTAWSEIARFTPFYTYSSTTSYGSVATSLAQPPEERYCSAVVNIGRGCLLIFGGVRDLTHRRDCHILDLVNESFVPVPRMIKLKDSWPTARKGHVMIYDEQEDLVYVNGGSNFKEGIQSGIAVASAKQLIDLLHVGIEKENSLEEDDIVKKAENELKTTEKNIYEDVKMDKTQEEKNQLIRLIETETIKIQKNPKAIDSYRTRADCYMKLKAWDKANSDIDEGLRLAPNDTDFKMKKGIILFRRNDMMSARLILTDVISEEESKTQKGHFPSNLVLRCYKIRAKCRIKERNFNEAIADANKFLKYIESLDMIDVKEKKNIDFVSIASWLASIYIVKATAFERKKQYDSGLTTIESGKEQVQQFLKKVKKSNFSFTDFLSFKNEKPQDVYLKEKLEKYESFLMQKKDKSLLVDGTFRTAKVLIDSYKTKLNELDAVKLKEQEEIIEEETKSLDTFFEEYLFKEMSADVVETDCDQAIELLKQVISWEPFEIKYIIALSEAYYLQTDYKSSIKYAKKVIEMAVDYWKAYYIAALCYLSKRKIPKAIEMLEKGIENCEVVNAADEYKDMDGISDREGFAQLQQAKKDAEKKKEAIKKASNLAKYAKQLVQISNFEDALLTINEVIEMDPTNIPYLADKVDILIEKKKYLHALKVAVLATRIAPKSYEGYLAQGVALQFLKRYFHSIQVLEKALKMFPDNSNIKQQLMKSKDLYKKKQMAQMKYERALFILQDAENEIVNENSKIKLYKINITTLEPSKKIISQVEQIVQLLDEAIELYPYVADFYFSKAKCRYLLRNYIQSVAHIKEAIEVMKQITDGLYLSYLSQRSKGSELDEEKKENTVDRVHVDFIFEAISLGARAYASMRQFDIAINYLKDMSFRHTAPKKKKLEDYERHLYLNPDHLEKLEELTNRITGFKKAREKFDFLVKSGMEFKSNSDFNGAISFFSDALQLKSSETEERTQDDRDYASIYFERAECFYELGDYDKAIEDAEQAVKLESTFPHFNVLLCKALMEAGKLEESVAKCNVALSESPYNTPLNDVWHNVKLKTASYEAEKHYEEGMQAIEASEFDVAISCLNKAVRLRPNNINYLLARSQALYERLKYKRALDDCQNVLKFDSKNIVAIRLCADIQVSLKNFSEAKAVLQNGMDLYPKDKTLRQRLEKLITLESQWNEAYLRARDAEDCYNNGNYEQSLELYSIAIQLHSDCAQYLCRRARVLLKLSQPELALVDAQKAADIDTSEEVYATLATIYLELCDYEKAKDVIEESLAFDGEEEDESIETLLLLKEEIYDREAKSISAKEKDEEGQIFFERYMLHLKQKKEEIKKEKQEQKETDQHQEENLYSSIFSKLSIFNFGAKKSNPIEIDQDDHSYEDLLKAQELFSEAVLLEPNNKRYMRHHIEALMLDNNPEKHDEAFNQAATMIQMFPNYTDGFCTAARLHAEKFRNTFESLYLSVVGLEHDREREGLSIQIMQNILNTIDNYEIPMMKSSKTLKKLGKVSDKSQVSFDSANAFEELEGHEIVDNVIGTIKTKQTKKEDGKDPNVPTLSLEELLDGDDFDLQNSDASSDLMMEDLPQDLTIGQNKIQVKKINNREEQVEFTKQLYDLDKHSVALRDSFANVRAFITGFAKTAVNILKTQREEAFDLAAKAVYVMYYDVETERPTDKFHTLFDLIADACYVGDGVKNYKLRELKKIGPKSLLLETCTTRYHRFIEADDDHPFYSQHHFENEREYENFKEVEKKNISEALQQFNLSIEKDIQNISADTDEDLKYRHVIMQQFVDCILQYSLYTVDEEDEKNKEESSENIMKTKILTLKDESLEVIQAVSNFYGYGDGVFAFLVLLEKLGRTFKHTYSEIGNIYKCLLHLIRTLIARNLMSAGKIKKKDRLLDDDPVIQRYYLSLSERSLFVQAAKTINRELNFIIDNHWKSANESMDSIVIFAVKTTSLIHAFTCLEDCDGHNMGYKTLSVRTKEGIENSMVNLYNYYRDKIIQKIAQKDATLQQDESGGLHPVHLLCLIDVLLEHIPRYETHFDMAFPSSVGLMKTVCNQVYSCIEIELHKLKTSKFKSYTEKGELPIGLFDLPPKIDKIYQLLSEHANVQPYALKDIFIPYVYKWIETFEKSATDWCKRAIDISDWKPITDDVTYTTAVVDTFTSIRQSLVVLETSLQFLQTQLQRPAQFSNQSILDSFNSLEESTSSKFGTGNSSLETLPLIYVTYTHVIASVIENFANMTYNIFADCTMKMKKIEEEYVNRRTSAKYKDMMLRRKTTPLQQQQEEKLYEETRKDVHRQIVTKMGLCMNNILESINQVRTLAEDIQKQLLRQQSELVSQIDENYELGTLDDDLESQSIDLSTTTGSALSKKKKDDLLEGMAMMHDTMKVLHNSLKDMIRTKMNNHLSQLIFKTMKESLLDAISKISKPLTPTPTTSSPGLKASSSSQKLASPSSQNLSDLNLDDIMTPLFDYLDDQLATLYTVLNDKVFAVVLRNIFAMLIDELKECAIPPLEQPTLNKSQIDKFKTTFDSFIEYFNANGSGLDMVYLKEHFKFISSLFNLSLTPTKKLIDDYNELSVQIEDVMNLIESMNKDLARKDDPDDINDLKRQIADAEEAKDKINVTKNYIFAVLHRRAMDTRSKKINDSEANKFVTSEMSLFEANQAIINDDYELFQKSLKTSKDNYQQAKQALENTKKEVESLKKQYKHVKSMRVITNERKNNRFKCKSLNKEIEELEHQKTLLQQEEEAIKKLVATESEIIEKAFFDMEKSDYIKDISFRLDAFVRSCKKGLAGQLGEEFMNFMKFPTKLAGVTEEETKLVITDFFRCMFRGNDGFLCLLSSPDICISWIPIISLIKLFKLDVMETTSSNKQYSMLDYLNPLNALRGTAQLFTSSEPQYNTQIDYIKVSVGKIKSVYRSTFGAGSLDNSITVSKSDKDFQFSCFKDREKAFEVIQAFILKNASQFKSKDSSIVNKLLFMGTSTTKEDEQDDSDIANAYTQAKVIKKGYPVSESVRKIFNLKAETRLLNKYSCTEFDSKLIGEFYVFSDSVCFTTTVNSGSCQKMILPFTQLVKISKVGKNLHCKQCIQLTNAQRVSYTFVNFKNSDDVFQEIIEVFKRNRPGIEVVMKADNTIAIPVHPTQETPQGLMNISKYTKFFKL
nr:unnamed protein product [Naegleria fowleri]